MSDVSRQVEDHAVEHMLRADLVGSLLQHFLSHLEIENYGTETKDR